MNTHRHNHLRISDVARAKVPNELNNAFVSELEIMIAIESAVGNLPVQQMRKMNDILNKIYNIDKFAYKEYGRAYRLVINPIRYQNGYGESTRDI